MPDRQPETDFPFLSRFPTLRAKPLSFDGSNRPRSTAYDWGLGRGLHVREIAPRVRMQSWLQTLPPAGADWVL
jgi:hypothetical protein